MKACFLTIIVFLVFCSEGLSQKIYDHPDFILHIASRDTTDAFGFPKAFGNFNDDNFEDLVILAPNFHNSKGEKIGKAYLFYGTQSGIDTTSILEIEGIYPNTGSHADEMPALSTVTTGDFNNDGYDDLALGNPWRFTPPSYGWGKGYAMIFLSRSDGSGLDLINYLELMDFTVRGRLSDPLHSGDVNGDHIDDLIVSAPHSMGWDEGRIYIYYGGTAFDTVYDKALISSTGDRENLRCIGVGDINNDGFDDIAGWDYENYQIANAQLHFWWGDEDMNSVPAYSRPVPYDVNGCVGDINNDSFADIIISIDAFHQAPPSNPNLAVIKGDSTFDINNDTVFVLQGHHSWASAIRDVNGDGVNDIFVDVRDINNHGTTYVFSGDETNYIDVSDTLLKFVDSDLSYGLSVGNIVPADMNGDGEFEYYGNSEMVPYKNVIVIYDNFPGLIAGSINYYSDSLRMVPDAVVLLSGYLTEDDTTKIDGSYDFSSLSWGNYSTRPGKEHDLDNAISAYDASLILRYAVGLKKLNPHQMIGADVSGNGAVTAYDASLILQYVVGRIDSFPVMPDASHFWRFVPTNFPIDSTNWSTAPDSLSYEPLVSDTLNQNFVGIIYGDVSGNWNPGVSQIVATKAMPKEINVSLGEGSYFRDNIYSTAIELDNESDLISASFGIKYDPVVLKILDVNLSELTSNFSLAYQVDEGQVKIALAGIKPLTEGGNIVTLRYELLQNLAESNSPFLIIEAMVNEGNIITNIQQDDIRSSRLIPSEFGLSQNYPNPFNSETTIKYQVPRDCHITLKIFNVLGQELATIADQKQQASYYTVRLNANDFASGIYFYMLEAKIESSKKSDKVFSQIKKLLILK